MSDPSGRLSPTAVGGALVGLGWGVGGERVDGARLTPDALGTQGFLRQLLDYEAALRLGSDTTAAPPAPQDAH